MNTKSRTILVGMLAATMAVSACSGNQSNNSQGHEKPVHGGILKVAIQADPSEGLDPQTTTGFPSQVAYELVYNSLVRYDKQLRVVPDLAKSWNIPNPKVYIFHLRHGVKFQNGQELTANDVKFSFDRLLNPATHAPYAGAYEVIKNIQVLDKYDIKFTLSEPYPDLLRNIALLRGSAILSKKFVQAHHGDLSKVAMGTGPFELVSYTRNQSIIYKRNPDYFRKGLPYLDGVDYDIISDPSSRLAAVRSGTVDMSLIDPQTTSVVKNSGLQLVRTPSYDLTMFNVNASRKPFNDPRVREAISLTIDPQQIINTVRGGKALRSGPIPTGMKYSIPVADLPAKVDRARAKQLLAEAGYPNGFHTTITTSRYYPQWPQIAVLIQSYLADIGITANIKILEWGTFLDQTFSKPNYDTRVITASPQEPSEYIYDYFDSKSPRNRASLYTGELDHIVTAAKLATNPTQADKLYRKAQMRIMKTAAVDYISTSYAYYALQPYVHGFQPVGMFKQQALETTWLDSSHR